MPTIPIARPQGQTRALPTNTTQAVQGRGMGQVAGELGRAGQVANQIGERAARERDKLETAEVIKAESDFNRGRAALEIKFSQLQGRNAAEQTEQFQQELEALRAGHREFLANDRQKALFLQRTENGKNSTLTTFERHIAGESRRMQAEAFRTYEETAREEVGRKWADTDAFNQTVKDATDAFRAREAVFGSDPETANKRLEEGVRALHVQRMNSALASEDAVAAREVFEQSKGALGGAAEAFENRVRALELPAQAEAFVAAAAKEGMVDGSQWFDPQTARDAVERLPDSDPRKPMARDLLNHQISQQDDHQRRLWDKQLSELSALRFTNTPLSSKKIQSIMAEATDPRNRYSAEARRWYQGELDRARMLQDRASAKKDSTDKLAWNAYHAISDINERLDPSPDGSTWARTFRQAYLTASPEMRAQIEAERNKDRDALKGGLVGWSQARQTLSDAMKSQGLEEYHAAAMTDFDIWYRQTKESKQGKDPTAEELSDFIGTQQRLFIGERAFASDKVVPGAVVGSQETGRGYFAPKSFEPAEEQPSPYTRGLDRRQATQRALEGLRGQTGRAAEARERVDARLSGDYRGWGQLLAQYGERAAALIEDGVSLEDARRRLTTVELDPTIITANP
jgi:hypothetical protein